MKKSPANVSSKVGQIDHTHTKYKVVNGSSFSVRIKKS